MTVVVNPSFVDALLGPITGGADIDTRTERHRGLDPDDEAAVRAVIRNDLVPYYRRWDATSQVAGRLALAWCLSWRPERLTDAFEGSLPPFNAPAEPAQFFEWLWDELFPGEDHTIGRAGVEERDNPAAANEIVLAPVPPGNGATSGQG
ncbi:MAG: hypothetical protein ACRD0F_06060 [Acidimicrobiales bacterium]